METALKVHRHKDATTARVLMGKAVLDAEFLSKTDFSLVEESISIWRKLNNEKELGIALVMLVEVKMIANNLDNIKSLTEEAIQIFTKLGDERQLLRAKTYDSFIYICRFKPEKALPFVENNLKLAKEYDMTHYIYLNQHMYGDATLLADDYVNGEIRYGLALKYALDSGNIVQAIYELRGVANAVSGQKRYKKSLRLSGAVDKKWAEVLDFTEDSMPVQFWAYLKKKHLGAARKALGAAAEKYEREGREMDFEAAVEYALDFDRD
jgi:hypothetical protein